MSWKSVKLGEICTLHYGKSLQNYSDHLPEEGSARVFGTNGPIGWTKAPLTKEPTIIVGRKGAYRGVHISNGPSWTIDTAYFTSTDSSVVDLRWFFYRLRLLDINSMNSGAAIPSTKREDFYAASISLPDLPTQQRIAGILSAYDDLIENNRRRIGLLEQAARLLYREWFVHLRFPGHETAKIVDGLPEGWNRGIIADLFDTSSGGTPSRKNDGFFGGNINWLKTQELENCFIFETDEKITEDGLKHSSAKMFPENTVIVAMYGATIGQLAVLAQPSSTNQACCALLPKRAPDDYLFAYCLMEHSAKALKDLGQGAAQNNVSQQVIRAMEIVIPSNSVLDTFNASILDNFQQRRNLQAQNIKLTRARDLLLPRLMDGRIPV